ncbi:peptidoglycan-binding domain-containing protein [Streptomyces decoyicus]|uniref:peptidoglycan-binding domain-containing protein n=1 Tax=Streptomyces decoyicus TaxID=249567 RepID=UPI000AF50D5C|nr:peptidoglycan-binding domain-containing protein [Streptomyces decoyicus]
MTARTCPHCSAPVRGGGHPTCLCAAVDAEDFDPLRIRPYVSLPDEDEDDAEDGDSGGTTYDDGPGGTAYDDGRGWPSLSGGDRLEDLPGVDAAVHRADAPSPADTPSPARDSATGPLPLSAPSDTAAPPSASTASADFSSGSGSGSGSGPPPLPRARRRPGPASRTFRASEGEESAGPLLRPRRRPRALPAVLAAAGAAVAAAAVLITTDALSGGTHDRAAPPDRGTVSPSAGFPTDGAAAPTRSAAAPSRSATRSPSPDATGLHSPTATVQRYRTTSPPPPAPTRASGSVTDSPGSHGPSAPPTGPIVLREGADGPEVAELQGRLRQLAVYTGPDDGHYGTEVRAAVSRYQQAYGVTGDPDGVYGARTRASLESRTHEP